MLSPYKLIALFLGLTSTVLAQQARDGPPRYPQCPAVQDAHQDNNHDTFGQAGPCESETARDSCSQSSPSSQASIEQSTTTRANGKDRAQQQRRQVAAGSCGHGKSTHTTQGSTRKPRPKNALRTVLTRPLPPRSIIYYRRRRFAISLFEFRMDKQRQALLALKRRRDRIARKQGYGHKLKLGNYRLQVTSRWERPIYRP